MKKLFNKTIFLLFFILSIALGITVLIILKIIIIPEVVVETLEQWGITPFIVDNSIPITAILIITYVFIIVIVIIIVKQTKELTEANERLKELDRLKDMFLASMSHELRTPLQSIIGFTRMILKGLVGEINEEQEKQLNIVLNNANHLLELINEVIDISKIEAEKIDIRKERYDLVDEFIKLKESFFVTAEKKGIEILTNTPENLMIFNDIKRINQILVNLIGNAIKFTDEGSVSIRIQRSNETVEISVKDTGPGIKKENLEKLFKPFSRIIEPGKFIQGTGLGLHISKKLANLLGGDVFVESEFGKGSTFTLSLKLNKEEIY